jgi:Ca2+-binding EF-hand superfamily protein
MQWRRSYEVAPPSLYDVDFAKRMGTDELLRGTTIMNEKYVDSTLLDETLRSAGNTETVTSAIFPANAAPNYGRCLAPSTESLQQCEQRVFGYWKQVIAPRVKAGDRVLIVAHANTLRALVKAIDKIEDKKIPMLKIPNGIPLVYTLNEQLDPVDPPDQSNVIGFNGAFLVSARNHDKVRQHAGTVQLRTGSFVTLSSQLCAQMMMYESCVRKKLRSLFQYLDIDGNGTVTEEELLKGLTRLNEYRSSLGGEEGGSSNPEDAQFEYSVEELIRSVPTARADGGITLKSFLEAEETLLTKLTRLKLLQ